MKEERKKGRNFWRYKYVKFEKKEARSRERNGVKKKGNTERGADVDCGVFNCMKNFLKKWQCVDECRKTSSGLGKFYV